MKKIVAIAGPTGMLGSMMYNILKDKYRLVLIYKNSKNLQYLNKAYGGLSKHKKIQFNFLSIYKDYKSGPFPSSVSPSTEKLRKKIGKIDAFINCAGVINKKITKNIDETFFINSVLPKILSSMYRDKLIHFSTDCVFSGINGAPYTEKSYPNPNDLYGFTKNLGEPSENSLVFRTSFIGPEVVDFASLLEWLRQQKGKEIKGYTNHFWNGLTTKQVALICEKVISNRSQFPRFGVFHLFSTDVSKYYILNKINEKYQLNCKIVPVKVKKVDRRLRTIRDVCASLHIPSFDQMIEDL